MAAHTVKKIDDMEAVYLGAFKRVRAELGVESFGIQVIDLPPNFENYPEHDHAEDGQEEVFTALRGGGEIEIDGERGRRGHPPSDRRRRSRRHLRGPGNLAARRAGPDGRLSQR
jgi:hypothetical protein